MRNYDREAVVAERSNLLIEGDPAETQRFVSELAPHLHGTVVVFSKTRRLDDARGVVLVPDVDRLDAADQQELMALIERAGEALQIICTSATPLFRRVERGDFLAALYYRLNTVRISLPGGHHLS